MIRGEIYFANLEPAAGSEQGGTKRVGVVTAAKMMVVGDTLKIALDL